MYALTPQGRVVELPGGATPIDFAYQVHTELGHRCRGAKVNGVMVPLNTKLKTGETVEIITVKEGGPSRDWLNPDLGFAVSPRTRTKVRQWFNAQTLAEMMTGGREKLDRELARLGKTSVKLEDLAKRLGYDDVNELCVAFYKEELSGRSIEQALQPQRPELVGFVTRGRGVTIHRIDCPNAKNLAANIQERMIEVSWGTVKDAVYPIDILVVARDRFGLIKDISEVFMREKQNIIGINTMNVKGDAHMRFSVEVHNSEEIHRALAALRELNGVMSARRA